MAFLFSRFLDHTQRRNTVDRTPLDEWSARRRDFYQTTHNTQQTNVHAPPPPTGGIRIFNLSSRRVAADVRLRGRAATGTGTVPLCLPQVSHGLTIDWTRPFAMTGRRLTAGAIARPWTPEPRYIHWNPASTSQQTHCISITKTSQLMV
jgi:hypothetical protein